MSQPRFRIAIMGAGIAGLAVAIALSKHPGVEIQIYEKAAQLQEIGASIALGPNGMRTLERLGVHNALDESIAFRNKSRRLMIHRHYQTNEVVSVDVHKGEVEDRHLTARFYRAHLQEALLEHIEPSRIHLARPFQSVEFDDEMHNLHIRFVDGSTASADLLLGADGVHSPVRIFFVPSSRTSWTGGVTFRSVFPAAHVAHIPDLPDEASHFWGPGRFLFTSPLGRGLFTVVGSNQSDPAAGDAPYQDAVWNSDGDVDTFQELYRDWSPLVRSIVDATPHTRIYPNAAGHSLDTWVLGDGQVTLVGDAAHAHGGAFAAGGSLALDDAWAFAASLLHVCPATAARAPTRDEAKTALRLYEKTRKEHTDKLIKTVQKGNTQLVARLGKPESDDELRARMRSREDVAWIHEHDVEAAFANAVQQVEEEDRTAAS